MRRREFIRLLGGATVAWPISARAQQGAMPVIGFLGSSSKTDTQQYISGFLEGMGGFGYVEERSYVMQQRYAEGDLSRLPLLVQELLRLQPQVIVADSTPGTLAAKKATPDVPIVGLNMTDPVGLGLVVSEAHPGTNVTGTLIRVSRSSWQAIGIGARPSAWRQKDRLLGQFQQSIECGPAARS